MLPAQSGHTSPRIGWRCDNCESIWLGDRTPHECPCCDVGPLGSWTGATGADFYAEAFMAGARAARENAEELRQERTDA